MLSRWERQALHIIDITYHEQSHRRTVYYLASHQNSYSEIEIISNSHPAPCLHKGQEQLQNIKMWTNWQSSFVSNMMANHRNLFNSFRFSDPRVDLPEPMAISKSCQRPKRNFWARHLHCSSPTNLKFLCFLPSAQSCAPHKSHLRRGGRTWYPDCNWNCTGVDILEI